MNSGASTFACQTCQHRREYLTKHETLIFYSCIIVLKIVKWLLELVFLSYLSRLGNLKSKEKVSSSNSSDKGKASPNSKLSSYSFWNLLTACKSFQSIFHGASSEDSSLSSLLLPLEFTFSVLTVPQGAFPLVLVVLWNVFSLVLTISQKASSVALYCSSIVCNLLKY